MTSSRRLTKELPNSILDILSQRLPDFRIQGKVQPLSGGLLNYVWRVTGDSHSSPRSMIIKWSPPFIASIPDVELDPQRSSIEAKAMTAFEPREVLADVGEPKVRAPYLCLIDEEQHFLAMEDLGAWPDLGAWLRSGSHSRMEAEAIGISLGRFIGKLHRSSMDRPDLAQHFNNHTIQRTRLEFQYKNIQQYAQTAGLSNADEIGRRAVEYGEKLQEPGLTLIMGDLWPPSILVTGSGLRIIDWELAHYGRPSQDIGHLAAHLWMHSHRAVSGNATIVARQLLDSFLSSYRATLGSDFDTLFGIEGMLESSTHLGSEVLTRTAGVFQKDYLYAGLDHDDPVIQEAIETAARHICQPEHTNTCDALGWRTWMHTKI